MKESWNLQEEEFSRGVLISQENSAMMRTFREKSRLHDYITTRSHEVAWRWNDLILHHYQYCPWLMPVFLPSLAWIDYLAGLYRY